jgi:hypothetical protein
MAEGGGMIAAHASNDLGACSAILPTTETNVITDEDMEPTRRVERSPSGYVVYVQPPLWMELPEVSVFLTPEQYERYMKWLINSQDMIQNLLPDLSDDEREMLISGIGSEDFQRITRDY